MLYVSSALSYRISVIKCTTLKSLFEIEIRLLRGIVMNFITVYTIAITIGGFLMNFITVYTIAITIWYYSYNYRY